LDPSYLIGYYRAAISYYEMEKFDEANEIIEKYERKNGDLKEFITLKNNIHKKKQECLILSQSKFIITIRI